MPKNCSNAQARKISEEQATILRSVCFHIRREWYRRSNHAWMKDFPNPLITRALTNVPGPATPAPSYGVSPSYQARQYEEQLYNFQNFNGQGQAQYYGANGKKWRWTPLCSFILTRQWSFKRHLLSSLSSHHFPLHPKFDWKPVFCVGRLLWYKTHGGDHHHFIVIWEWNVMSDCAVCVMLLLLLLFTV